MSHGRLSVLVHAGSLHLDTWPQWVGNWMDSGIAARVDSGWARVLLSPKPPDIRVRLPTVGTRMGGWGAKLVPSGRQEVGKAHGGLSAHPLSSSSLPLPPKG